MVHHGSGVRGSQARNGLRGIEVRGSPCGSRCWWFELSSAGPRSGMFEVIWEVKRYRYSSLDARFRWVRGWT